MKVDALPDALQETHGASLEASNEASDVCVHTGTSIAVEWGV